ncbi:DUF1641 domain-containing protein [Silvibacterium dinghuense]|uniref:DUF1641 domain-containing protein n=1 Tax=Silvibacterium dinghuense TaxID=1560006 RepID=A0A4Q1SDP5_9BACT|nr:DUF1641 domain-containing protein [Silvibacterium dinghuense]RXS95354.1 DUF1641 domain-containing protein [Silvibacterium dinghuense]GGH12622.1 hypothetical protein GCM10011586_32020 [Silvibacterium dinghuense]
MAKPIELLPHVGRDPRAELRKKVEEAPVEHAEAVLSAYALLEQMHESGVLDTVRGVLGAGDRVIEHVVGLTTQPEAVTALRNLLILSKVMGSIPPDTLHSLVADLPQAMAVKPEAEPPSFFALLRKMMSKESRRAMALGANVLEAVGKGLGSKRHE